MIRRAAFDRRVRALLSRDRAARGSADLLRFRSSVRARGVRDSAWSERAAGSLREHAPGRNRRQRMERATGRDREARSEARGCSALERRRADDLGPGRRSRSQHDDDISLHHPDRARLRAVPDRRDGTYPRRQPRQRCAVQADGGRADRRNPKPKRRSPCVIELPWWPLVWS